VRRAATRHQVQTAALDGAQIFKVTIA